MNINDSFKKSITTKNERKKLKFIVKYIYIYIYIYICKFQSFLILFKLHILKI